MSEPKADYTRQLRWDEAQRDQGLTRSAVWVPARDVERLRNYAGKLRKQFEKEKHASGATDNN